MAYEGYRFTPKDAMSWRMPGREHPELSDAELAERITVTFASYPEQTTKGPPFEFYGKFVPSPVNSPTETQKDSQQKMHIFVPKTVMTDMQTDLYNAYPNETIGLLIGRYGQTSHGDLFVDLKEIVPMSLVDPETKHTSTESYISLNGAVEADRIHRELKRMLPNVYADTHILGTYHVHPIGTNLSHTDTTSFRSSFWNEPYNIHWVQGHSGQGSFYRLVDDKFIPEGHYEQTAGYKYERNTPIPDDVDEYLRQSITEVSISEPTNEQRLKEGVKARWHPFLVGEALQREEQNVIDTPVGLTIQKDTPNVTELGKIYIDPLEDLIITVEPEEELPITIEPVQVQPRNIYVIFVHEHTLERPTDQELEIEITEIPTTRVGRFFNRLKQRFQGNK